MQETKFKPDWRTVTMQTFREEIRKTKLHSPYDLWEAARNHQSQTWQLNLRIGRLGVATAKEVAQWPWWGDLGISWVEDHTNILRYNSRLDAVVKLKEKEQWMSGCSQPCQVRELSSVSGTAFGSLFLFGSLAKGFHMCSWERELSHFLMYLVGEIICTTQNSVLHSKPRARPVFATPVVPT